MADSARIGIVTVTYNSAGVLPEFLSSLSDQTHRNFVLYAVDNASRDASLELLSAWNDPRLRVIANTENRGVAGGNNQGIRAAIAEGCSSVLLLNNDTSFGPSLLAALVDGLNRYAADMICPKMVYHEEPDRIWAAGGSFRFWLGYSSYHYGEGMKDRGQFDRGRRVTYVPTCCVLIRSEVFEKVGGMDERYFVYSDDTDFMYRAMKAGIKLYYLPEEKLLHKVGVLTGGEESPFSIRYGTRNRIYFQIKHLGLTATYPWLMIRRCIWWAKRVSGRRDKTWYRAKLDAYREGIQMGKDYRSGPQPEVHRL